MHAKITWFIVIISGVYLLTGLTRIVKYETTWHLLTNTLSGFYPDTLVLRDSWHWGNMPGKHFAA